MINLNIIPDGSLGKIAGNIKNAFGFSVENVIIKIDNDTTVISSKDGSFNITLPYKLQKEFYVLQILKRWL